MATFLQLCSKLATRSGAVGTAPAAVTGQTGRQAKCVDWIEQAWSAIQNDRRDWTFRQGEWSGTLSINTTAYTDASFSITRFAEWKGDRMVRGGIYRALTIYDPDIGEADEGPLQQLAYEQWRQLYDRGEQTAGKPVHYAFAPDGTLRIGPKPDKAYPIRGEYLKAPQVLAVNADEPDLPDHHHDIIVSRALILIAEHDEAQVALQSAVRDYSTRFNALCRDCLPEITTTISR